MQEKFKTYKNCEHYQAFQEIDNLFSSDTEKQHLLPVGIVNFQSFDKNSDDKVLIAIPNGIPLYENSLLVSYSLIDGKWELDKDLELDIPSEGKKKKYENSKSFFSKHGFLQYRLDDTPNEERKIELIELGGNPPCGQNWNDCFEADHEYRLQGKIIRYDDLLSLSDEDFDKVELLVFDESKNPYTYIGHIETDNYVRSDSWMIIFYEPIRKRVLLTFEFS